MKDALASFIDTARRKQWRVEQHASPLLMPAAIARRYPRLPDDVVAFLSRVSRCSNPADDVWFVTHADFTRPKDYAGFAGDAFERMSLDALQGDPAGQARTRAFWDRHFPLVLSVGGDYAYAAAEVSSGEVVYGEEPMFEEASRLAPSFPTFLANLEASLRSGPPDGIWALFA